MVFKSLTLRIEEEQDLVRDGCPGEHHDKASQTAKTSEDDPEDPRNVNKDTPRKAGPAHRRGHLVNEGSLLVRAKLFVVDD